MNRQLIFMLLAFLCSSIPILFIGGGYENVFLQFEFLLIALICSISLFLYVGNPFSLFKMFHLFCLFFLCIAPMLQYREGIVLWGGGGFSDTDYILTTTVVLCSILVYNAVYTLIYKNRNYWGGDKIVEKFANSYVIGRRMSTFEGFIFFLLACFSLYAYLYSTNFNIFSLFFRGDTLEGGELLENVEIESVSKPVSLIITNFIRPLGVILFLFAYKLDLGNRLLFFLLFIMMLLVDFPTAMPRFSAAALYIPVVLFFWKYMQQKNVFVLAFILGLLIVFPFLNNFRYYSEGQEIEFGLDFDMFLEGHFDTYSSLMRVLSYDVVTYGMQLLGSIFFWVPRSIWPSKPIGSGAMLAEEFHLSLDNISCCYLAEGYINGGFLGLLLFVVFIAFISAVMDKSYWKLIKKGKQYSAFELIYFLLLGLFFFLLRGDMMSSFAFMVGFIVSATFVYWIIYIIRKFLYKRRKIRSYLQEKR